MRVRVQPAVEPGSFLEARPESGRPPQRDCGGHDTTLGVVSDERRGLR